MTSDRQHHVVRQLQNKNESHKIFLRLWGVVKRPIVLKQAVYTRRRRRNVTGEALTKHSFHSSLLTDQGD